jgi:hypothetical protein
MRTFFESKTTADFKDGKSFWKFYNSTIKTKKSKESNTIASIVDTASQQTLTEPIDIANTFNKHFTNIAIPSKITESESKDYINKKFTEYKTSGKLKINEEGFKFKNVTVNDVLSAISTLDTSSSPGNTQIPVSVIKDNASTLAPVMLSLFNECLAKGEFPSALKYAIVYLPLFKKGDKNSCNNYRGISILSPFAKIFERLLSAQITSYFTNPHNTLFTKFQHGFRANHSCETALQTIIDKWLKAIESKMQILALFIDFIKAFDFMLLFLS